MSLPFNDYLELDCGCKITPVVVQSMCIKHYMAWRENQNAREKAWAEVRREMERAAVTVTAVQEGK